MRSPTASSVSETGDLGMLKHVQATAIVERENSVLPGGHHAHTSEEEATSAADEQQLKCSFNEYSVDTIRLVRNPLVNLEFSQEDDAKPQTLRDVLAAVGHGSVLNDSPTDAPVIRTPRHCDEGNKCAVERSNPYEDTVAAVPPTTTPETPVPERATVRPYEEAAASVGDGRRQGREETPMKETPNTCLPDVPPLQSVEDEDATTKAISCRKMSGSPTTKCLGATAPAAPDVCKGCEGGESQEECLRRVLWEMNREALECTQERMQRSVCFLLETRKEKEAEQLALLRERRRLDAMLADAQKQLVKYSHKCGSTGAVLIASSLEFRNVSATCGFVELSTLSGSSTREASPASQLQLLGCGRSERVETALVDKACAASSVPLRSQPPLERGRDGTAPSRCLERQPETYRVSLSDDTEEGYENVLADFLGDILHKYGPAAVKGVGAAAHIVKEGLGVLRQELLDLQQHQQATERQRAIERHARYMLRRQEELERLQHHHLMQQLQHQSVLASGSSQPLYLGSSEVHGAAATAESGEDEMVTLTMGLRSSVGKASGDQEAEQHEAGKSTSSQGAKPGSSTPCRAQPECIVTEYVGTNPSSSKTMKQRDAYICSTDKFGRADALATQACESEEPPLHAESLQQMLEGSLPQDEQLQKRVNKAVPSLSPPNCSPETRTLHVTSNFTSASDLARRHQHVGADPDRNKDVFEKLGGVCTGASAKAGASSSWREFFSVEGKSSPPPHQLMEHGFEIEKSISEAGAVMNGSIRSRSIRSVGQGGSMHSDVRFNRGSVYRSARPVSPISSTLPSPYKTLGTRKERLQRTAASFDSISRGVADAVGSVKHTIARWFYVAGESTTASIEERALTHESAVSDAGDASCISRVGYAREQTPSTVEPSALHIREEEIHDGSTPSVSVNSHAAADAAPVAERPPDSPQRSYVDPSVCTDEKGDLSREGPVALEAPRGDIPEAEETTRNSSVLSLATQLADRVTTDAVLGIVDETVSVTGRYASCMQADTERYGNETGRQMKDKVRGSEKRDCKDGHTPVSRKASAADKGSADEVCVASTPSSGGRHDHLSGTAASVVRNEGFPASTVTGKAVPAGHSFLVFDPNGRARDVLPVRCEEKEASRSQDSGGDHQEERTNKRECSASEEDPPVIEASIRVGSKNGMVALPLVVLATEQCRDVAEEWVDRHWVQLQQTHLWLMRGKTVASEPPPEEVCSEVCASDKGLRGFSASAKPTNEVQASELDGDEAVPAGRHASGSGAAKTAFLTRSRAIHSLAAFLGHAEATSESLPVRVVEDWENIIVSPSAGTTRELRQHTRHKNSGDACIEHK